MKIWNISILVFLSRAPSRHVTTTTPLLFDFMKVGQNLGNIQIRNRNSRVRVVSAPSWWLLLQGRHWHWGWGPCVFCEFSFSLSYCFCVVSQYIVVYSLLGEKNCSNTSLCPELWLGTGGSRVGPRGSHSVSQCRVLLLYWWTASQIISLDTGISFPICYFLFILFWFVGTKSGETLEFFIFPPSCCCCCSLNNF